MTNLSGLGTTFTSPDTLLEYCQTQLDGIDGEINGEMSAQETALREREAVQGAQKVLEQFGTAGPQNVTDFQSCVDALNTAIAQLPANDPVATQLAAFRDQMCSKYGFRMETIEMPRDQVGLPTGQPIQQPVLDSPPNKDAKEWQGTTDALSNLADDVKSNADIQMLGLQDLVSQRQQIIESSTSMMSKTDQTLEDQAKAIGQ